MPTNQAAQIIQQMVERNAIQQKEQSILDAKLQAFVAAGRIPVEEYVKTTAAGLSKKRETVARYETLYAIEQDELKRQKQEADIQSQRIRDQISRGYYNERVHPRARPVEGAPGKLLVGANNALISEPRKGVPTVETQELPGGVKAYKWRDSEYSDAHVRIQDPNSGFNYNMWGGNNAPAGGPEPTPSTTPDQQVPESKASLVDRPFDASKEVKKAVPVNPIGPEPLEEDPIAAGYKNGNIKYDPTSGNIFEVRNGKWQVVK